MFYFLILIPSVIIGVAYYGVSYHSIIDIAKKNILDVVVKNTQLIDRQMSYIQDSAVNLNVDQELYRLLSDVETVPDSELLVKDKKIQAILQKYFVDDDIVTITIMTEKFIFGDNSQLKVPVQNFSPLRSGRACAAAEGSRSGSRPILWKIPSGWIIRWKIPRCTL